MAHARPDTCSFLKANAANLTPLRWWYDQAYRFTQDAGFGPAANQAGN